MSVASTKPAPTNKQLAAKLEGIKDALRYADIESLEAGLTKIISILEASTPLDVERTALKELRERLKASIPMYEAKANNPDREEWSKGYWAGRHQEAKKRLAEIGAQERTGATA